MQAELLGDPEEGKLAPEWPQSEEAGADAAEEDDLPPGFNMAAWTYYQWTGLRPDGRFAPFWDVRHRVLGELTPLVILPFAGERVIVLGPCPIPMSWEGFPFPDLHDAYFRGVRVVERLSPAAVRAWLRRIRTAPRPGGIHWFSKAGRRVWLIERLIFIKKLEGVRYSSPMPAATMSKPAGFAICS